MLLRSSQSFALQPRKIKVNDFSVNRSLGFFTFHFSFVFDLFNQNGLSPFHVAIQNAKSDAVVTVCQLLLGNIIDPNNHRDSVRI